jgi:hypothetical protein
VVGTAARRVGAGGWGEPSLKVGLNCKRTRRTMILALRTSDQGQRAPKQEMGETRIRPCVIVLAMAGVRKGSLSEVIAKQAASSIAISHRVSSTRPETSMRCTCLASEELVVGAAYCVRSKSS